MPMRHCALLFLLASTLDVSFGDERFATQALRSDDECLTSDDECSLNALQRKARQSLKKSVDRDDPDEPDDDVTAGDAETEVATATTATTTDLPVTTASTSATIVGDIGTDTTTGASPTEAVEVATTEATTTKPACASSFQQCGGEGWKGVSCCVDGSSCQRVDTYYHQCMTPEAIKQFEVNKNTTTTSTTTSTNDDPEHCGRVYEKCDHGLPVCCQGGTVCKKVDEYYSMCAPATADTPVEAYTATEELKKPSHAPAFTFYIYRSQMEGKHLFSNINAANLAGALWYLHNEVVWMTPRKFNITRLARYKITTRATEPLHKLGMNFGIRFAYDKAQCTGPWSCDTKYQKYGYFVGCNNLGDFPFPTYDTFYPGAKWYALPGKCPAKVWQDKDDVCSEAQPGGRCEGTPTGQGNCTYSIHYKGEISVDELEGITDYDAFVRDGNEEFNKTTDVGIGVTFWNSMNITAKNLERIKKADALFKQKYPDEPSDEELQAPPCDFNFDAFYTGKTTSSTTTTTTTLFDCQDATPGDQCYQGAQWAKQTGIRDHPAWYPGLTSASPLSEFQKMLHSKGLNGCKMPCGGVAAAIAP